MFRIARSKLIQTTCSIRSVITIYLSVHVRWPARPAEHRAGLEFSLLLSLLQGKESNHISILHDLNFTKIHGVDV